jgi:hypothetical protein
VEALLDHVEWSVDNYCGVNGTRRGCSPAVPTFTRAEGKLLALYATPQKSFGDREATIHTRRVKANSERPY